MDAAFNANERFAERSPPPVRPAPAVSVRASNTNPYLTLRFEGRSEAQIEAMKRVIYGALRRYPFVTLPG